MGAQGVGRESRKPAPSCPRCEAHAAVQRTGRLHRCEADWPLQAKHLPLLESLPFLSCGRSAVAALTLQSVDPAVAEAVRILQGRAEVLLRSLLHSSQDVGD